ncbi:haloacid dehalogenase-like hydrolase domain-containing 5 [Acipenser oxyrinchus oxyrinchus]|uniref:Haloacid dehalogenase-like hydrolase domain-containing 5 n=1 Tax=Acipenser oxyrinchus oxyrinchus TaxID=40147 RepID=A0AAD8FQR7_ACIOX|nr:haloacid dehalogenase-like hydrolase domain-containing 5 [Acipenser oxyrinchus oxyrinchus]
MRGFSYLNRAANALCSPRVHGKVRLGRCGLCGTASDSKLQPAFGLLFDIDGVLVRGKTPIPAAKKAFQN